MKLQRKRKVKFGAKSFVGFAASRVALTLRNFNNIGRLIHIFSVTFGKEVLLRGKAQYS
jgi:hypothetical protein